MNFLLGERSGQTSDRAFSPMAYTGHRAGSRRMEGVSIPVLRPKLQILDKLLRRRGRASE